MERCDRHYVPCPDALQSFHHKMYDQHGSGSRTTMLKGTTATVGRSPRTSGRSPTPTAIHITRPRSKRSAKKRTLRPGSLFSGRGRCLALALSTRRSAEILHRIPHRPRRPRRQHFLRLEHHRPRRRRPRRRWLSIELDPTHARLSAVRFLENADSGSIPGTLAALERHAPVRFEMDPTHQARAPKSPRRRVATEGAALSSSGRSPLGRYSVGGKAVTGLT